MRCCVWRRQTFPSRLALPNFHSSTHLPEVAEDYGGTENVSCNRPESLHAIMRSHVPVADRKQLEHSMIRNSLLLNAFHYLASGSWWFVFAWTDKLILPNHRCV